MGGVLLFSFAIEPEDWSDFGVLAHDNSGATGEISNTLEYRQPRIISVDSPSGSIGDFYTARAVVEGEEPFVYDWVLTNGVSPNRSSETEPEVELVQQGSFSGYLAVSNRFDERRHDYNVTVGVPPIVASVEPLAAVRDQRTAFSAEVTGSSLLTYNWDFGADAFPRRSSETQPDIEFDENGTHDCSLRVSNAYGEFNYGFEVSVGSPPEIVNITPTQGTRGETERFFAEVLGSEPFNYSWTFTGVGDPSSSTDERPLVDLRWPGEHMCKLVVSNAYGDATRWFDFYVGEAPEIFEILWSTTTGNTVCYFFADVTGDFPMTWTWTFDMYAPDPPYVIEGVPTAIMLPDYTGVFNCQLVAENAFGSDTLDFEYEITDVFIPPPPG
jgi:PKD repeat protein